MNISWSPSRTTGYGQKGVEKVCGHGLTLRRPK